MGDGKIDRDNVSYLLAPLRKHIDIFIPTKIHRIKSIFFPTLCYENQTWTLNQAQSSKIQTCEMHCLRKITNNTIRDKIRNVTIREKVGLTPCIQYIEKQ
jgi:hypothetical protein